MLVIVLQILTTVSIRVDSSMDSDPPFDVSLILTATIFPRGHFLFFDNRSADSDIRHILSTGSGRFVPTFL